MRPVIIIMSHGNLAQELVNSAKMIIGEMKNVFTICMQDHDGLEGTNQKLSMALQPFNNETSIIILADLKGGTPCNVAVMKMNQYQQLRVISGVNLPMLIEASLSELETSDALSKFLTDVGKFAVENITPIEISSEVDGYEE